MSEALFIGGPLGFKIMQRPDRPVVEYVHALAGPVSFVPEADYPETVPYHTHTYYRRRWVYVNHELPYDGSFASGFVTGKGRLIMDVDVYFHEDEPEAHFDNPSDSDSEPAA